MVVSLILDEAEVITTIIKNATNLFIYSFHSFIFIFSKCRRRTKRFCHKRLSFRPEDTGDEDGRIKKICKDTK